MLRAYVLEMCAKHDKETKEKIQRAYEDLKAVDRENAEMPENRKRAV